MYEIETIVNRGYMKKIVFVLLASILISSYGFTQVKTILKDTRFFDGPMEKVALITQANDESIRLDIESSFEEAFTKKKIDYTNAYDLILPDTLIFYSTLERLMYEAGTDAVLIVKLVDVELTDMYIIPGGVLPPDAYNYYEFYSVYFYYDEPLMKDSSYLIREDRTFRLDANLYQGKGDMIIWSVQSKPIDPADYEKTLKSFANKLAHGLISEKLVKKKKK